MPAHTFASWTAPTKAFDVIDVSSEDGWNQVRESYSLGIRHEKSMSRQLEQVIAVSQSRGVSSVLVEYRYVDADWRSEHANFYGSTFARYPSICHRLHFFACALSEDLGGLSELDSETVRDAYRGYSVMRPLQETPVGRTMITPPPELLGATLAEATETVHLFGTDLSVSGMPFISQDAMYLRCAHASIWMVLRYAHLRHGLPRQLPGDIRDAGVGGMVVGRQLPSDGLSTAQMLDALDTLGLPTGRLKPMDDPGPAPDPEKAPGPGGPTLYGIACRYVSSELPPIVVSSKHCWVIVAWKRVPSDGHKITLWRHDDARGPYIKIDNPWAEAEDDHDGWQHILPPLLPKMNLDAESAESAGATFLANIIEGNGEGLAHEAMLAGRLTWRTFAVSANEFKARLGTRGLPPALVKMYRLAQLPRTVWLVEAVDREARDANRADVLGTAVFDSTHAGRRNSIQPLAGHLEDVGFYYLPDIRRTTKGELEHGEPVLGDQMVRNGHATSIPPPPVDD